MTLTVISRYNGQLIQNNITEGLHDNIDINISVLNTGNASINTILIIKMKPFLNLTKNIEKCKTIINSSSYRCDVNRILEMGKMDNLDLHFVISEISTENIEFDFAINTSSDVHTESKLNQSMKFDIIRKANLNILELENYTFE